MRERDIFIEALQKESPADRGAYLHAACEGDTELRSRVERLLLEHERQQSFILDSPAVAPESDLALDPPLMFTAPGTVIGRYKLLEPIGEGGYGTVFMAEQTSPVQRKVALKIIKAGMDTRQVIARFEAERQALALMDHPNIAKVFDAGVTDTGRPYFVMELVKGVPITKYCDEHKLLPRQRLELFVQVCQAVQHAHQKGIIHRDIKPTNVLVAQYDGKPVPSVIDFGVAKATGQQLTERTMFTGFGDVIGTPQYMSPEQAELNQLDIDTRSDIYSLGVLLYELLTGTTPLEAKRVKEAALLEVLRVIREEEPPRPSTRLTTVAELASIAAQRGLEPKSLSGIVRGELDWIVMRALEKDRTRRYETANGLARDIERYLNDEAVLACPPSPGYRFRKFAQRNKVALGTGLAIAAVLVLGTLVSTWQAIRATRAEAAATASRIEAEANFQKALAAVDEMLTQVGQESLANIPQMEPVRRALLEKALVFYQEFLQQRSTEPRVRLESGRAYLRVSQIYYLLGQHLQAEQACDQAVLMLEELESEFPDSPIYLEEAARSHHQRGVLRYKTRTKAIALTSSTSTVQRAEVSFRQALNRYAKLAAKYPDESRYRHALATSHAEYGRLLMLSRRNQEAEASYGKAVALHQKLAADSPNSLEYRQSLGMDYNSLADLLERAARPDEAERYAREAIKLQRALVADAPLVPEYRRMLALSLYRLAKVLFAKFEQAEPHFRAAATLQEKLVEDFPAVWDYRWELTDTLSDFGQLLASHERPDDAKEQFARAAVIYAPTVLHREKLALTFPSEEHDGWLASSYTKLGWLLQSSRHPDEALDAYRKAIAARQRLIDESNQQWRLPGLVFNHLACAQCFAMKADPVAAATEYRRASEFLEKAMASSSPVRDPNILNEFAWRLATAPDPQFRNPARAVRLAKAAVEIAPKRGEIWNTLGVALYRAGDWQGAVEALGKSMELRAGGDAVDWFFRAMAEWQMGNKELAREWYGRSVDWLEKNAPANEKLTRFRPEAAELLGVNESK